MTTATREYTVHLRQPHAWQQAVINSPIKRKIIRSGRRAGKTVGVAILAVLMFLDGRRILYAAPTEVQVEAFWTEVKRALQETLDAGLYHKDETKHLIEQPRTDARIRAKTAWNADTLRGDWGDLLILDEWQLMNEDAWERVGAPMLLDRDGDAIFIYTPPSLHSRSASKANDSLHAAKMFKMAQSDKTGRWAAFHWTSHDNPYISEVALSEIGRDMTALAYRQEILAEDVEDAPGALWTRALIERSRVVEIPRGYGSLVRVVAGVDPTGGEAECGIVVAGLAACGCRGDSTEQHLFILEDSSMSGSPDAWAGAVLSCYGRWKADRVVAERNYGGDMVESTLRQAARARNMDVGIKMVTASRGKAIRAEPIAAQFEQGRAHFVGSFPRLEEELCQWVPGDVRHSPNRLDAMVWAATALTRAGDNGKTSVLDTLGLVGHPKATALGLDITDERYQDTDVEE